MLFNKLNPLAFALALGAGLMLVYVLAPRPKLVIKFPTPENAGKTVYRDTENGCYVYESEKVACGADAKMPPAEAAGPDERKGAAAGGA
eukprot:jgi/Tetstr1/454164/TSEL_041083.t1